MDLVDTNQLYVIIHQLHSLVWAHCLFHKQAEGAWEVPPLSASGGPGGPGAGGQTWHCCRAESPHSPTPAWPGMGVKGGPGWV